MNNWIYSEGREVGGSNPPGPKQSMNILSTPLHYFLPRRRINQIGFHHLRIHVDFTNAVAHHRFQQAVHLAGNLVAFQHRERGRDFNMHIGNPPRTKTVPNSAASSPSSSLTNSINCAFAAALCACPNGSLASLSILKNAHHLNARNSAPVSR